MSSQSPFASAKLSRSGLALPALLAMCRDSSPFLPDGGRVTEMGAARPKRHAHL